MLHSKIKHFRKDFVPDTKEVHHQLKQLEEAIKGRQEKIIDRARENITKALAH
jgi:hypothetical protein